MKCIANHCGKEIEPGEPLLTIKTLFNSGMVSEMQVTGYVHAYHVSSELLTYGADTKYPLIGNLPEKLDENVDYGPERGYVKGEMAEYKPHLLVNCWCGGSRG